MSVTRWGGLASTAAGVLWLLIWMHQAVAHGTTQVNEKRLVAGLTWMDSSKFVAVLLLLLLVGLVSLFRRRERPGTLGTVGRVLTFGGLGLLIVATALEFWTFRWGSYAASFEDASGLAGSDTSAVIQLLVSLDFTLGLALPAGFCPRQSVAHLGCSDAGCRRTDDGDFTPVLWMPGVAWIVLGIALWRPGEGINRTVEATPLSVTLLMNERPAERCRMASTWRRLLRSVLA